MRPSTAIPIIEMSPTTRAVSSVGQSASFTPRRSEVQVLHRPPVLGEPGASGHGPDSGGPRWRNGRRAAFRAQCPYGCVGSNPSLGTKKHSRACSSEDRALPCGGRGREFESRQARHFPSTPPFDGFGQSRPFRPPPYAKECRQFNPSFPSFPRKRESKGH